MLCEDDDDVDERINRDFHREMSKVYRVEEKRIQK